MNYGRTYTSIDSLVNNLSDRMCIAIPVETSGGSINLSIDSEKTKKATNTKNIPLTNPANTSALRYLYIGE